MVSVLSPAFKPFKHQTYSAEFYGKMFEEWQGVLNTSDCGTGKTGGVILFLARLKDRGQLPPVLVLGPLSILEPAWAGDIDNFAPGLTYSIAYAKNRKKAFETEADIYITNHDAIKFLEAKENRELLNKFKDGIIVIDEFTAFKNPTAKRTKAMMFVGSFARMCIPLSGTPRPKSILDIFVPAWLCDKGERLGKKYYAFRAKMCYSEQVGRDPKAVQWREKTGANMEVSKMLEDITLRFAAKDCQDLPPNRKRYMHVTLPTRALAAYREMEKNSLMENENGELVSAINAAARNTKLLQLCTGAAYDGSGNVVSFHKERYQLVFDLVREVDHSIVAFNWRHERDAITAIIDAWNSRASADERINYAYIDGTVKDPTIRAGLVKEFQAGRLHVLLCHPQSAGHGLTLTRGVRTIWCSATNNAEHFIQLNHRIDRAGQSRETETIMIAAKDTKEMDVYKNMIDGKIKRQSDMLAVFQGKTLKEVEEF